MSRFHHSAFLWALFSVPSAALAQVSTDAPQAAATKTAAAPETKTAAPPEAKAEGKPEPGETSTPEATPQAAEDKAGPLDGPAPEAAPAAAPLAAAPASEAMPPDPLMQPRVIDVSGTAPPKEPEPEVDPSTLPFTYHQRHIDVALGARLMRAGNKDLEPYLNKPALGEGFVRAGSSIFSVGPLTLAALGEFGWSNVQSTVRSQESRLNLRHFTLGLEGRYHFHHRTFAYVRVAPGAELAEARIGSQYDANRLEDSSWAFQLESALGVSLRVIGSSDGRKRVPRAWLFAEAGGRYSGDQNLELTTGDEGPERPVALDLGSPSTSGFLGTAGMMLSF